MVESDEENMTDEERAAARLGRRMRRLMALMIFGVVLLTLLPLIVIWLVNRR